VGHKTGEKGDILIGRRDPHGITAEKPDEGDEAELAEWLAAIVRGAPSLIRVLLTARALELPDWLIMSGALYQRVLNALTKQAPDYGARDYDLGYFDSSDISYEAEDAVIRRVAAAFDEPLRSAVEVRNQARVHVWFKSHFGESYTALSCIAEALARFVSPMFAVGVRLKRDDRLHIAAPVRACRSVCTAAAAEPPALLRQLLPSRGRRHPPVAGSHGGRAQSERHTAAT
jgi:hypothetical protein